MKCHLIAMAVHSFKSGSGKTAKPHQTCGRYNHGTLSSLEPWHHTVKGELLLTVLIISQDNQWQSI